MPYYFLNVSGVLSYVTEQWLNKQKEWFVSAWTHMSFNFNNCTNNRDESQHAKLKRYLKSKKYSLDQFLWDVSMRSCSLKFQQSTKALKEVEFIVIINITYRVHPYVTDLQDVIGDGNCGFRFVTVALSQD